MPSLPPRMPPLPAVYQRMLDLYVPAVQSTLGAGLDGLYVYGSVASGDFIEGKSDLDLLAVLTDEPTPEQRAALDAMHAQLVAQEPQFNMKFEVFYMPKGALNTYDPAHPPRPRWNAGKFYDCWQGHDWVLHRKQLREKSIPLYGPPLTDQIAPVMPQQIKQAVAQWLLDSMAPYMSDPARIHDPFFQSYTILTMCRALYTLENGQGIAKGAAAEWAVKHWPEHATAIKAAAQYTDGQAMPHFQAALELLSRMVDRARHVLQQNAA